MDDEWNVQASHVEAVKRALNSIEGLFVSIYLGHQMVLGGTDQALHAAQRQLPIITMGSNVFPLKLPFHSAFHTPIMLDTSQRAVGDLWELDWRPPEISIIDGKGKLWQPKASDGKEIRDYTLIDQVVIPFDFRKMIRTAVCEFAPDKIILLGPGSNLGSAVAQSLININWKGIRSKKDFVRIQTEDPFLLSMGRPEQRLLVCAAQQT